jgi:hypothetical protein
MGNGVKSTRLPGHRLWDSNEVLVGCIEYRRWLRLYI